MSLGGTDTTAIVAVHPRVTYRQRASSGAPVDHFTRITWVGRDCEVSYFANTGFNLITAISARVFMRQVGSDWVDISSTPHPEGIFDRLVQYFVGLNDVLIPLSNDDFIATYKGMRKIRYQQASDSLDLQPLTFRDAECKCFLKREKDIRSDKPHAIPRVITFPDPRYGLSVGCFIKACEHRVYEFIDEMFGSQVVMKGKNYRDIAAAFVDAWSSFDDPVAFDADVSRLDSSISDEALRFTHCVTAQCFDVRYRDYLLELLSWQIGPKVTGKARDASVSYILSGLASGQMNTSLVGVLVVCAIIYDFSRGEPSFRLINCGDDFTIVCDRFVAEHLRYSLTSHFAKFNMVLKPESIVDVIERINFCQTSPVCIDGIYRMVRNPFNALVKDSTIEDRVTTKPHFVRWLNAVADGGLASHGDVPIFRAHYLSYKRNAARIYSDIATRSGRKRARFSTRLTGSLSVFGKGLEVHDKPPSDTTRFSFYLAFGISPSDQRHIEEYYDNLVLTMDRAHHPQWDGCPWFQS